ncbi:MAG: ATP synthase subunit I [Bacillota bacterium]
MSILNYPYLVLSFIAGVVLGGFFFGGLWWTVQKMRGSKNPYLVSTISFVLRTVVVMFVFYLLLGVGLPYLVASLVGFVGARTYLAYRLQPHR